MFNDVTNKSLETPKLSPAGRFFKLHLKRFSREMDKGRLDYCIDKVIRCASHWEAPILFIEKDGKIGLARAEVARFLEENCPVYMIEAQKLHDVEHIKKAVQNIVDAELVPKGILASKMSLDSLESATDLLIEAINLAISQTSCAEKINKLQTYAKDIERIKSNQR